MLRMWHTCTRHLQRLSWSSMLGVAVVAGFILGACTTQDPAPLTAPQATATPSPASGATPSAEISYQPAVVPEAQYPSQEALETALAEDLVQDPEALCEWEVWGQVGEELYAWAVCETSSGSAASAPAVVRVSVTGQVESVRRPRDGTYYGSDIQEMFPQDVQQRILANEFDAVAAMDRIAERRAAGQGPQAAEPVAVTIYFGNSELNPNIQDCRLVYPVVRLVTADDDSDADPNIALAKAALVELFAGPTKAELGQGYVSMFSAQTASILRGLNVEGQTAYVNLADIRQSISSAGTSCGGQAFLAEVGQTVQAVLPVDRVLYAIEGDPAVFYDFMQFGCDDANDFCDPAPFEHDED